MRRVLVPVVLLLAACEAPPPAPIDAAAHRAAIDAWKANRYESLMQPDGWLSLVALHWLPEGATRFGADSANDLVHVSPDPAFPAFVGTFHVRGDTVRFVAAPAARVTRGGTAVSAVLMEPTDDETYVTLDAGTVRWIVIRRQGRYAVRAWDAASPVRTGFAGIEMFPLDGAWRIPARFESREPPDTILIPNVLGGASPTASPARVAFIVRGERYTLDLWKDSDDLDNFFTAFGDATNGAETYGGGRFLWIDAPDENGWTIVDFNRAYNPPCVFTEYATCPLPPRQNRLPLRVEAGERAWAADGER